MAWRLRCSEVLVGPSNFWFCGDADDVACSAGSWIALITIRRELLKNWQGCEFYNKLVQPVLLIEL